MTSHPTSLDDLRRLAYEDKHARDLADMSDEWFEASKLTVRSTPGAAVATTELTCPVEPRATAMIKYWTNDKREGISHFVRIMLLAFKEAERLGSRFMWGFIKDDAPWLNAYLEPAVQDGVCRKVRGSVLPEGDFSNGTFYIVELSKGRRWLNAQ